ncbi:hypothetical protein BBO99_00003180 [Phytophthora kernoviae]|uniref:Anoctamin transmembrane domain-containing protein n=2 Tax=Phytophthora kernoviae TaxID=325452 RepID=A0A3R7H1P4_9STRA|nr:hypothetical protein G195_002597 [Phytophthora kernoviae 00238/432]KAG2532404.1 hypothetical protein JM16_000330 [Phytophthora kernoviae]RLN05720.1 hypothetical protein BBI17_003271 [Phytophthora kernoviae]RLN82087.1 hypothetical protein BBO99_00003180 [Phytophthora kernoviae]
MLRAPLKLARNVVNDGDVVALEEGRLPNSEDVKKNAITSPRLDAQLGGYPPDCGTKELKYLSYAKVLRDRGMTHSMRYSATRTDALGFAIPERYPLFSTDFGAHSFHQLPTDSVVLSQHGLGIALYFKYLKVITWLFLLLIVISAPALAVYIVGLAVGCDIACSVVFFGIVVWLRRKEKEAVDRIAQDQIKAQDYTVQLVNLPPHDDVNLLRQEIRLHLEAVLSTAQPFAVDIDRIRVADIQFDTRVYGRREQRHLRAIHKLETKLHRFNVKLEHHHARVKRYNNLQAVTAFVTFEEEEGFHRCLQEYPDLGWLHRLFQPYYKRLHDKRLRFRPAPDPTDIIWENLHHPFLERMLRQLIVALITMAVLFLSFVLIFAAKEQKSKLERQFDRPSSCPSLVTKPDVMQDELNKLSGVVPYKALVECYCKNFLATNSFRSMLYEGFYNPETGEDEMLCRSWATTLITTQVLSTAAVLLVVAVNLILARVLNALVAMEKHHTQSNLVVSRVTKVFIAQFCNTALLMLAINANGNYFSSSETSAETGTSSGGFSLGSLRVLNGEYSDFSADWYNDVGVALMLTMIINSFSTHAYLLIRYIALKARRFVDRGYSFDHTLTRQDTQRDLETLYRGPKFDLAARYAQSLTSIFITYLFSAGMPLLHFIGFAAMMMTYWADKFTFLRIARSPPLYDSKVATAAGSLLPYAVLMHCLVAMWMFSNDRIFESESDAFADASPSNSTSSPGDGIPLFDVADRGQLISRVTRPQVVVLFAFFVAGCAIIILRTVLFEYVPAFVRNVFPALATLLEKHRVAKDIPNYFDDLQHRITTDRSLSPTAISDNKEYVAKLAIDSHLSETIPLDQIF